MNPGIDKKELLFNQLVLINLNWKGVWLPKSFRFTNSLWRNTKAALIQAKEGRIHILNEMDKFLFKSKVNLKDFDPRIDSFQVKPSKIGIIVGPSGKMIRSIIEETGCQVDINDDDKAGRSL